MMWFAVPFPGGIPGRAGGDHLAADGAFMIAKGLVPVPGLRSFAIMELQPSGPEARDRGLQRTGVAAAAAAPVPGAASGHES